MKVYKNEYDAMVTPTTTLSSQCGNMYCGSVYASLTSLLGGDEDIVGKKVLMFSYGSGLAASMFSVDFKDERVMEMRQKLDMPARLAARD
jgi:hydroxymethylglutaryl-CoA synthase